MRDLASQVSLLLLMEAVRPETMIDCASAAAAAAKARGGDAV